MSSLTQKGKASDHGPVSTGNASNSQVPASSNTTSDTQAVTLAYAPSTSNSLDQTAPATPRSSVDGWGELEDGNLHEENGSDKEGWNDLDPFEDQEPQSSLLTNILAAQKGPVVQPKQLVSNSSRSHPPKVPKSEDDALWGSIAASVPKMAPKSADIKPSSSHNDEDDLVKPLKPLKPAPGNDDDLWGAIAAPPPKSSVKPLKPAPGNDDDLWGAIAAPPPTSRAKPLSSSGRGRGMKPTRIARTSSTGI